MAGWMEASNACENVRNRLSAYLDGALSAPERAAVEKHLAACASGCRQEAAALRDMLTHLKASPLPEAPNLWPGVRQKLDVQPREPARNFWFGLDFSPLHGLALAATAVLIVVVVNLPKLSRDEMPLQLSAKREVARQAASEVKRDNASPRELKKSAAMEHLSASSASVRNQVDLSSDFASQYAPEEAGKELAPERARNGAPFLGGMDLSVSSGYISGSAGGVLHDESAEGRLEMNGRLNGRALYLENGAILAGSQEVASPRLVDFVWNTPDEAAARLSLDRWAAENQISRESDEARQDKAAAPMVVLRLNPEQLASLFQAFPQLQPQAYPGATAADKLAYEQALSAPDSAAKPAPARPDYLVRIRIQPALK